jgi:hypothetical protein
MPKAVLIQVLSLAFAIFACTSPSPSPLVRSREVPVAQYELSCRIRPVERRLEVEGTIVLPPSDEERAAIRFALREDMGQPEVVVLAPESCAGPADVTPDPVPEKKEDPQRSWDLHGRQPFPAGVAVTLSVRYGGGDSVSTNFHLHPAGCFAHSDAAWYPRFDTMRALGTIRYSVPDPWVVKAGGALLGKDRGDGELGYRFECRTPSNFCFVAGPYTVVRRREGRVPLEIYLLGERPFLEDMERKSFEALSVLEREFGPYPFAEFAIVEVATEPAMRSGFTGAAYEGFYMERADYLDAKGFTMHHFGHEMGHQWFPQIVGSHGEHGHYMLDEGLAQYGGLRCVEEIDGEAAAERFRRECAEGAARCIASGYDFPLGAMPYSPGAYELADRKGVLVYDLLARTMGRDRFRNAMKSVTSRYAYGSITWEDLLGAFDASSDRDLGWFYAQWFERSGSPSLTPRWSQSGDALELTIAQPDPPYRLPLPIRIELEDGSALDGTVELAGPETVVRLPVPTRVRKVELDPRATLPMTDAKTRAKFEAQRDYLRGELLWNHNKTEEALAIFREALTRLPQPDAYGVEFLLRMRIGWIAQEAERFAEARDEYERALEVAVRDPDQVVQLYWNLAETCRAQGDLERALWAARNVLSADAARGVDGRLSVKAREMLKSSGR